jgi:hypothetical protein
LNGYVLASGSVHPSGATYTVVDDSPIVPTPERINELVRNDSERVNASVDGPPIPYGSHDTELFRTIGTRYSSRYSAEMLLGLLRVNG